MNINLLKWKYKFHRDKREKYWKIFLRPRTSHMRENTIYPCRGSFAEVICKDFYTKDIKTEILRYISKILSRPRTTTKRPLSQQGNIFRSCEYWLLFSGHQGRNFELHIENFPTTTHTPTFWKMPFIQAGEGFQQLYVETFILRTLWPKFWATVQKFSHAPPRGKIPVISAGEGIQKLCVETLILRTLWPKFWDTDQKFSHAPPSPEIGPWENALYLSRGGFSEVVCKDFYAQDSMAVILSSISKIFPRPRKITYCPLSQQGKVFRSCV